MTRFILVPTEVAKVVCSSIIPQLSESSEVLRRLSVMLLGLKSVCKWWFGGFGLAPINCSLLDLGNQGSSVYCCGYMRFHSSSYLLLQSIHILGCKKEFIIVTIMHGNINL